MITATRHGAYSLAAGLVLLLTGGKGLPAAAAAAGTSATAAQQASGDTSTDGHAQLHEAVDRFLHSFYDGPDAPRAEIEVNRLDRRLRITACRQPLETSLNRQERPAGRVSIRVQCNEDRAPWSRYVQASVQVFEPVVVVTRTVRRGERLQSGDLRLAERDTALLRDTVYREPERAMGMALRRTVRADQPLTGQSVTEPVLVERGDAVTIVAGNGQVRISHRGTALQDGALGKRIRVRNTRSERVVQGAVTAEGRVEVRF